MRALTPAALFWLIVTIAGLSAWWAMATPFAGMAAEVSSVEAGLMAAIDRLQLLSTQLTELRRRTSPNLARYSTAAVDVTTEATNLQERARQTVASAAGSVLGSQANQQVLEHGDVRISVLIQAQLSEAQLMAALAALETDDAPFVIEAMTLDLVPGAADGRNLNAVLTLGRLVTHAQ